MYFSVIVPVYQAETTICKCLDSLIGQSFKDFEVILVDDGSSDNSGSLCMEYAAKDKRFRYERKNNGGPSSARNYGLQRAEGAVIVFLDSDDTYRETYLESFYRLIQANDDCDSFWCGYETITNHGARTGSKGAIPDSGQVLTFDRSEFMTLHEYELLAPLWNKAFRREIIFDHGLRMDESMSLGEDLLFNLAYFDCCNHSKIVLWNRREYEYYCLSNDSLSKKYRSDLDSLFRTHRREMLSCLKKWNANEKQYTLYQTMVFYMLVEVMHNYDHRDCCIPARERKRAVQQCLDSEEFQSALRSGSITIHPLLKYAYKKKNMALVHILEDLSELKRRLR